MKRRINPDDRRKEILDAGIALAKVHGYNTVTCKQVSSLAGTARSNIYYYFGTVGALRAAILLEAVTRRDLEIVAQAMSLRDPDLAGVPTALQNEARGALYV
jgi:AcrR family transcriptional regulator